MRAHGSKTPWLLPNRPEERAPKRLFCLPYAGGSAALFQTWQAQLAGRIEISPIILPGRDRRGRESALNTVAELCEAMASGLADGLSKPYAIFGHSMGALLGFELCHALRALDLPLPEHLFVAGFRAPQLPDRNPQLNELDESALMDVLRRLGGTPPEILECEGIMALLLPTIRADLHVVETYEWRSQEPLELPITAICASGDPLVSLEEMNSWREQTTGLFEAVSFDGGHFFLEERRAEILSAIGHGLGC